MFTFNLNTNAQSLAQNLKDLQPRLTRFQLSVLNNIAADMEAELKAALNTPIEFTDGKTRRSLPGEAPRKDSGTLQQSIKTKVESSANRARLTAGDLEGKAPYALYLEYGTVNISPRPYLMPALAKYTQIAADFFKQAGRLLTTGDL